MTKRRTGRQCVAFVLLAVVATGGAQFGSSAAFGTDSDVTTSPADSSTVASLGRVTITFVGPAYPAGAVGTVFTSDHKQTANGPLTIDPASGSSLVLPVPDVPWCFDPPLPGHGSGCTRHGRHNRA